MSCAESKFARKLAFVFIEAVMGTVSLAVTLFFVLDPFGNIPAVLGLLGRFDARKRKTIVARESLIALATLVLFYFSGPRFLKLLDVGPADLKISGGFVLGIIAVRMVFPEDSAGHPKELETEPFIVPLAIPLIAGPSAIATVMIMAAQSGAAPLVGLAMIALAWAATAVILFTGVVLESYIPSRLLPALERLSGLLLAVIAVHMLMTGIQAYFMK